MAVKITNNNDCWRVRLQDGEYELSLNELNSWVLLGRVTGNDLVRPPTTKRWKRADNAVEVSKSMSIKNQEALAEFHNRQFNSCLLYLLLAAIMMGIISAAVN